MKTSTVNIAFKTDLLKQIDKVAVEESRTRSELIREAARMYLSKKDKWNDIFKSGKKKTKLYSLLESDVVKEVRKTRNGN